MAIVTYRMTVAAEVLWSRGEFHVVLLFRRRGRWFLASTSKCFRDLRIRGGKAVICGGVASTFHRLLCFVLLRADRRWVCRTVLPRARDGERYGGLHLGTP